MTKPQTYQVKPITVEAMQLPLKPTDAEALEIYQWVESLIGSVAPNSHKCGVTILPDGRMYIKSLSFKAVVLPGDWVIWSKTRGFTVRGSRTFSLVYEAVNRLVLTTNPGLPNAIYNRENLY
jgi:hypothetical protein